MNLPATSVNPAADGSVAPGLAALAQLAFAASAPAETRYAGDAAIAFAPATIDSLDLDLSDPEQCRFGDYTLLGKLGQGGMGVVYRAHQHSLDREVAIKLLAAGPWASPGFIERFRQEAQSAARMQHPNIVTIHEIGEQDGLPFFSMRLVRGQSLAESLSKSGPLPARRAAGLLRTVAEAVDYAHRLGVLHLDLKPGNVLIDEHGEPMVADFGLARRLEETLTGVDEVSGTPSYMAPEQATAGGRIGVGTDVYALGATLYEALTGRPPFRGATARETLEQVVYAMAPSPRMFDRSIPLDLQSICMRCLHKDPGERYPTARALADDLADFLRGREVKARPLNRPQKLVRMVRREPRLAALLLLFVTSLLAGLFATTVQWNRADASADSARQSLWRERAQAAETALAEGNGFHGLQVMVGNLAGMESVGARSAADLERQRIGTLLANSPQLLDRIPLDDGSVASSVALAPDGHHFAIATHLQNGRRKIRQYDLADGRALWTTDSSDLTHNLSVAMGAPHGRLHYSADGRRIIVGIMAQPPFAAPMTPDQIALSADDGHVLKPAQLPEGFSDIVYDEQARHAIVRWRSQPALRFPDRFQAFRVDDWTPLGPEQRDTSSMWQFAPDGALLLRTPDLQRLQLVEFPGFAVRWTLRLGDDQLVRAWRFAPDGRTLALGGLDGGVLLVDVAAGSSSLLPSSPVATVRWLEFDREGGTLAALSETGELVVWDMATRRPRTAAIRVADAPELGRVRVIDGHFALAHGNAISLWQLPPPSPFYNESIPIPARVLGARIFMAHAFDFDPTRRLLITGGIGGIGVWRLSPSPLRAARAAPLAPQSQRFDGRRLVAVDGAIVRVVDIDSGADLLPPLVHPDAIEFAELSADGRWLLTIAGRTLRTFDAASGQIHGEPIVLPATPLRAELASAAPLLLLVSGLTEGDRFVERAQIIDFERMQVRTPGTALPPLPSAARLDPLGRFLLVSGASAPAVDLIDLGGGPHCPRLQRQGDNQIEDIAIAADGSHAWIQVSHNPRRVSLLHWDLVDCSVQIAYDGDHVSLGAALVALGDGVLAQHLYAQDLALVDRGGVRRRLPVLPAARTLDLIAVSPDGRRAAIATRNAVQVYDLEHGERLSALLTAALPGFDEIARLAFASNGERLLARSTHGRWMSWALSSTTSTVEDLGRLARVLDPPSMDHEADAAERLALRRQLLAAAAASAPPPAAPASAPISVPTLPEAAIDPRFVPLDLTAALNVRLGQPKQRMPAQGGDLTTLAPGIHRLGGVDWRIDGALQLSGGGPALALYPEQRQSAWVDVPGVSARRVHVLMLVHIPTRQDAVPWCAGRVDLRHADGSVRTLEIVGLRDVVTHWQPELAAPTARIAWRGGGGFFDYSHVYDVVLDLPPGSAALTALRLGIGDSMMEAPMYYAVTLEIDPPTEATP